MRTAVTALLRNAIEAAPSGGWARVRLELSEPQMVHVVVEDSGPGPDERACEHMFDPFFSGRSAGRGRGLGLPTAWRLALEHGGSVRHATPPGGPTRFILTIPHHAASRDCAA
jgi:signal transduction histidine kinase